MLLQLMDILSSLVRKAGSLIYGQSGKSRGIQTGTEYLKQGWNGDKAPLSPPAAIYHLGSRAGVRGSFVIPWKGQDTEGWLCDGVRCQQHREHRPKGADTKGSPG